MLTSAGRRSSIRQVFGKVGDRMIITQRRFMGMSVHRSLMSAWFVLIASLVWPSSQAWAQSDLVFCYDPYPPYTLGQEGPAIHGLKVELLNAVTERIDGVSARVELMPWKRCQAQARSGQVDGILPLFRNTDRETYLSFTRVTHREASAFFYNREKYPDGIAWGGDFGELSHHRLGMLNGSFIDDEMEKEFSSVQEITRVRDVKTLLQLLLKGRVDLVATEQTVGRYTAQQNGWQERISIIMQPISERRSRFGLSKASGADRHLDAFNRAILELDEVGAIEQIFKRTE